MSCRFVDTKVIGVVHQGCQVFSPPACRRETRPALERTVEGAHVGVIDSFRLNERPRFVLYPKVKYWVDRCYQNFNDYFQL